jgi:hypothetical protein
MKLSTCISRRWIRAAALGLTALALAAPAADGAIPDSGRPAPSTRATPDITDGLGRPLDPSAVRIPDSGGPAPTLLPNGMTLPIEDATPTVVDQPDGYQPQLQPSGELTPIVRDEPDGYQPQLQPSPVSTPVVSPDGFDWVAAGVGAGLALAFALVCAGGVVVTRRHTRVAAS